MHDTLCNVPQCINRGNGHVINDHLQAKKTRARRAPRYVVTTTRAEIKILYTFFLPDTLAVRLLGYYFTFRFASSSCRVYTFISKHTRNYARCYELMCQVLPPGGEACTVSHCVLLRGFAKLNKFPKTG